MGTIQSVAGDFLTRILQDKRAEVENRQALEPLAQLERRAGSVPAPRAVVLRGERLQVIAEVKRGSPSAGTFNADLDAAAQAAIYARGGAAAVSVLTDGPYFQGSLEDLWQVRQRVSVPLLRKDFILDRYQLLEARAGGADMVLLIVAALSATQLSALYGATRQLGMEALVEVNTAEEAAMAIDIGATLVGINNRDLHNFVVDMTTTERLIPLFPRSTILAALSGVRSVADAARMRAAGADAVLIGEALVRAPQPEALLAEMMEVQ